jgi:integrase
MPKTPGYRKRHDRNQAIVTLTDAITKKRRDYWLGDFGSAQSRELYHRVVAEWEANGRRLIDAGFEKPTDDRDQGITVSELCARYWRTESAHMTERDRGHSKSLIRLLRRSYGSTAAEAFGPKRLQRLRDEMIRDDPETGRRGWGVSYTNAQVRRLCRLFKWAASQELISATVRVELLSVDALRPGKSAARPAKVVKPVAIEVVEKTLPFMAGPVAAVVRLQLLTGARPDELLSLRARDIHTQSEDGLWIARPQRHKTQHIGHDRSIMLGPRAQALLKPFMDRSGDAFLFSPAEADAERRRAKASARKTPLSCGNRAGTNRKPSPMKSAGERYDSRSYYRAVQYACDTAFPPPPPVAKRADETRDQWRKRLAKTGLKSDLDAWRKEHRWFPYQLRHTAATLYRREHGLEASALVLGHASARVTDAVYAERDLTKVAEIMRQVG